MKLTLRSLLGWLDDMLSPADTVTISQQVRSNPSVKELAERIKKVTRMRRLTVPEDDGPQGVDPNLVAMYLENELSPEAVVEFERKCLASDVLLAEIASVHQIMSLVGQKAKVPADAKYRLDLLIKGQDTPRGGSTRTPTDTGVVVERLPRRDQEEADADLEVIAEENAGAAGSRWNPILVGVGGLLALAGMVLIAQRESLRSVAMLMAPPTAPNLAAAGLDNVARGDGLVRNADGSRAFPVAAPMGSGEGGGVRLPADAKARTPEKPSTPTTPMDPTAVSPPTAAATEEPQAASDEPQADPVVVKEADAPKLLGGNRPAVGGLRLVESTGFVFRRLAPNRLEPIAANSLLVPNVTHVSLEPSIQRLDLSGVEVRVWGGAEWSVVTVNPTLVRLKLNDGRLVLVGPAPVRSFEIDLQGLTLKLSLAPGSVVGIERLGLGAVAAVISVAEGEVEVTTAPGKIETLSPMSNPVGRLTAGSPTLSPLEEPVARWVSQTQLEPADRELVARLITLVNPNDLTRSLVVALDDPSPPLRAAAVHNLGLVGLDDLVVETLDKPDDPLERREAIITLRRLMARSLERRNRIIEELRSRFADQTDLMVRLLDGSIPAAPRERVAFLNAAVEGLAPTQPLGLRELALDVLMSVFQRDAMGYEPDNPSDRAIVQWRALINQR